MMRFKKRPLAALCALALALFAAVLPAWAAEGDSISFRDVTGDKWFYPYVTELAALGGVAGYQDGTFRPNAEITRAEVCAILLGSFPVDEVLDAGALRQREEQAGQANGTYWANGAIARACACGAQDFGVGKEEWGKPATREDIAYLIYCIYTTARKDAPKSVRAEAARLVVCGGQVGGVQQHSHPHHVELIQITLEDGGEVQTFAQGVGGVRCLLQHALVELEPGQLSVDITFMRRRSGI
uniref:SLH domain-containing protein n=1 Tax=uncultured prokaryote TaxID=198431 RepID=A0A0H5Q2T8_9ZZZZ|nr:hypothetical protein [uncultured prokaryote]